MAGDRIPTYPDGSYTEAAFNTGPLSPVPPLWLDITARALDPWDAFLGKQYELDRFEAGELRQLFDNRDGALDPTNTASPFAPDMKLDRRLRQRMRFGPNELTADQACAGEASGYLGVIPESMRVVNDFGYPLSIVASGSAFQGSQVYQAVLPSGAAVFSTVLMVQGAAVVPGRQYSFSAQVRIPSGDSAPTSAAILWFDADGGSITPVAGATVTPVSGSSAWVQVAVSGLAPAGAYSASLKVQTASGTLAASTTWQADGLQWENCAAPTPFQAPGTLGANLLPRAVATGTASTDPTKTTAANYFYPAAGTVAQAANLTAAPTGATVAVAWTTPAGTTNTNPLYAGTVGRLATDPTGPVEDCVQVTAGEQYTASVYLMRTASADATVQVKAQIRWFDATGAALSVSTGAAATVPVGSWVRATVTDTAPAGAVWGRMLVFVSAPSATTATNTVYATGWQLEQAAAATAWVDPGPTYFAFTGFWDQAPQTWKLNGTWGQVDALGVDALGGLAQRQLRYPFLEEVLLLAPDFFYVLDDPAGAAAVADLTGKQAAAPIENSPFGPGSMTLGGGVTANTPGSAFVGAAGPVATFANNPSQGNLQEAQTFIALHEATSTPGPPAVSGSGVLAASPPWTRALAFRAPSIPATGTFPTLWMVAAPSYGDDQSLYLLNVQPGSGALEFLEQDATGVGPLFTSASSVCDGNWHQVAVSYSGHLTGVFDVFLDGAHVFHDDNGGAGWSSTTNVATDVVGANVVYGHNAYVSGWVGDIAHLIQFPFALTSAQAANLYASWRTGSAGESTGARAARMLSWVKWPGATALDPGATQSMGPATDLAGGSALDGLNAIAETEGGLGYASTAGTVTLRSRTALYNSSPVFVFGEKRDLGEWPYADVDLPTDQILTYNIAPVQQYSTGQVAVAQDAPSQDEFFQRTMPQRTVNASSFAEVQSAAAYLLQRHKSPAMRCSNLALDTSAVPGLARVAAQLEIGTRIRVFKRPPGRASAIQFDGFVQRVERTVDPTTGRAGAVIEAFPADLNAYWTLAALHTVLASQAASGQAQATIRALPDAAVNRLASSLPQGYQLVFEPGTARQETMTLAPTGVPSTNTGYSSPTLTFTTNFAFTHPAGSTVCEPLPQGYTDPTVWDANSMLGSGQATLGADTAAGATTLTVGPLPDGAVNPLASDWSTGDLISIGLGTANAEGQMLTPNQATAGESGVAPLAAGTSGLGIGLSADLGTPTVTASASAFRGSKVWQTSVAANAAVNMGLLYLLKAPAVAGQPMTVSAYVRSATSGANPQVFVYIKYLDATSTSIAQTNGATTTLTGSPTAAWTRLTATATAPANAAWVQMGVILTAASPAAAWAFQADALQIEQASSAGTFTPTPEVLSVAAAEPGYSGVQITLAAPLVHAHDAGETVADAPGPITPAAGTARLAY